jgi:hypothetical protein
MQLTTSIDDPTRLLRIALRVDALGSAAFGVLGLVAGPLLEDMLGTPMALLWPVSVGLLAWGAGLWLVASRPLISASAVWTIIVLNLAWVAISVVALAAGWFALTQLGVVFVLTQAAAVALIADVEFVGLRKARFALG